MKLFRTLYFLLASFVLISCSGSIGKDEADEFVGTYSVNITEYVTWGYDSGTLTDSGTLYIDKVSSNSVKTRGIINTTGRIVGSFIYLDAIYSSDSSGYINTTFSSAMLVGNTLTITGNSTGQLKYNGTLYPYSSNQRITATKIQ